MQPPSSAKVGPVKQVIPKYVTTSMPKARQCYANRLMESRTKHQKLAYTESDHCSSCSLEFQTGVFPNPIWRCQGQNLGAFVHEVCALPLRHGLMYRDGSATQLATYMQLPSHKPFRFRQPIRNRSAGTEDVVGWGQATGTLCMWKSPPIAVVQSVESSHVSMVMVAGDPFTVIETKSAFRNHQQNHFFVGMLAKQVKMCPSKIQPFFYCFILVCSCVKFFYKFSTIASPNQRDISLAFLNLAQISNKILKILAFCL